MRPQPFLHDLVSVLAAPTVALSGTDGQLRPGGTQGVLCADRRLLAWLLVTVDDAEPVPIGHAAHGGPHAMFTAVARHLGDAGADPTVLVRRERTTRPDGLTELITVSSTAHQPVRARLHVRLGTDLAPLADIKAGRTVPAVPVRQDPHGLLHWVTAAGHPAVIAHAEPAADRCDPGPDGAELAWDVTVPPGQAWTLRLEISAETTRRHPFRAAASIPWSVPSIRSAAPDLDRTIERGMADLASLAMTDHDPAADVFVAAGSPWFFTLFGRDSLWTARMLLPLGSELAAGTLRVLARAQGTRYDERTGEAPGKIIHEVRDEHGGVDLPPRYFGTIDATPLWICTLRDAWRWGLPTSRVMELLGPLRAAVGWLTGAADPDGDGLLEYLDAAGSGLANQGWKDSPDAVQWPDGSLAEGPIALCEAQAYAHQAALAGAELLAALGTDGDHGTVAALRRYASDLRARFREAFWVRDATGRFPALALDGAKRPVPVAASNLGHLLDTELLTTEEAALVADRLGAQDLSGARGLRTLSDRLTGANPLGYHTGTVWPHDTAITVLGLARAGHGRLAARLADGLLSAAGHFDHRLPELFGGTARDRAVLAYPASCRPQAWAAAAPVMLLTAALGLRPDVPAGTVAVGPDPAFASWFPLRVTGLRLAGHPMTVTVAPDGSPRVDTSAPVAIRDARPTGAARQRR